MLVSRSPSQCFFNDEAISLPFGSVSHTRVCIDLEEKEGVPTASNQPAYKKITLIPLREDTIMVCYARFNLRGGKNSTANVLSDWSYVDIVRESWMYRFARLMHETKGIKLTVGTFSKSWFVLMTQLETDNKKPTLDDMVRSSIKMRMCACNSETRIGWSSFASTKMPPNPPFIAASTTLR